MQQLKRHTKRVFIGAIGFVVLLIGLVLIPYPGPGWLIVFGGLAILATEFAFAQRLLDELRRRYDYWVSWLKDQPRWLQLLTLSFTGLIVVVTVWFVNGFGLINHFLHLGLDWLVSPLFR